MATTAADHIVAHLTGLAETGADDFPPTAKEIAAAVGVSPSTASTALRKLENDGQVRKLGVAPNGARTWALADTTN